MKSNRYNNINALRALAAISIVFMHVRSNLGLYNLNSTFMNFFIAKSGVFVRLFFMISGFVMCLSYYDMFKNKSVNFNDFYMKRFIKILPFFATLTILDVLSTIVLQKQLLISTIIEAFSNITLLFGLFPQAQIEVVGVGWTLGVIFGFYILFPFFVFCIWDKKRAWLSLFAFLIINFICTVYFVHDGVSVGANTIRWMCYFIMGGIIYLYLPKINEFYQSLKDKMKIHTSLFIFTLGLFIVFKTISLNVNIMIENLFVILGFTLMIISTLFEDCKLWCNFGTNFISKHSFEIYLSHMMVFRVLQILKITDIFSSDTANFYITVLFTVVGSLIFSMVFKKIELLIFRKNDIVIN